MPALGWSTRESPLGDNSLGMAQQMLLTFHINQLHRWENNSREWGCLSRDSQSKYSIGDRSLYSSCLVHSIINKIKVTLNLIFFLYYILCIFFAVLYIFWILLYGTSSELCLPAHLLDLFGLLYTVGPTSFGFFAINNFFVTQAWICL